MGERKNINQDMVFASKITAKNNCERLTEQYLKAVRNLKKYKNSQNIDPKKLAKYEEIVANLSKYAPKEK